MSKYLINSSPDMDTIRYVTADEAVSSINSNERVFIQGGAATPQTLVNALTQRHRELKNVEICHLHTEGDAPYAHPDLKESFHVNSFFVGKNIRPYINHDHVQYIPVFLSEVPLLFRNGLLNIDTALIQVSVPDQHGYCSLGISVDVAKAATEVAKKIIALVNPNMPRSLGDGLIHYTKFTSAVYTETPILEVNHAQLTEIDRAIGKNVAEIIDDGATLQTGIGGIPNAVLHFLTNHKNLGIHTEMFSDGILPLIEKGIINGSMKNKHPGKIVSAFAMGTRKLYDFINNNPSVAMLDAAYVNDTSVIRKNDKVTAINSAIEIDLTGQVCADSIGSGIYSGVGGQMDFIRGAALSKQGKPIIAIGSITSKGISKIVPQLKPGAGVVTTRAHVHHVATEYGVVNLFGKNIAQRAKLLISIAHPDHQAELEAKTYELYGKSW